MKLTFKRREGNTAVFEDHSGAEREHRIETVSGPRSLIRAQLEGGRLWSFGRNGINPFDVEAYKFSETGTSAEEAAENLFSRLDEFPEAEYLE